MEMKSEMKINDKLEVKPMAMVKWHVNVQQSSIVLHVEHDVGY